MKKIYLVIIFGSSFLLPSRAFGDPTTLSPKASLIRAVKTQPACDEAAVSAAMDQISLDKDIVLEALENGCGAVFQDRPKLKAWLENDNRSQAIAVAIRYLEYASSVILPAAKKSLQGGGHFLDSAGNRAKAEFGFDKVVNPLLDLDCINEIHPKKLCDINSNLASRVIFARSKYQSIADTYEK